MLPSCCICLCCVDCIGSAGLFLLLFASHRNRTTYICNYAQCGWLLHRNTSCFQQLGRNSAPFSPDGEMILILLSVSSTVLAKCAKINSVGTGVHRPRFKTSHSFGQTCSVFNRPLHFSGFDNQSASLMDKEADGGRARSGCCSLL